MWRIVHGFPEAELWKNHAHRSTGPSRGPPPCCPPLLINPFPLPPLNPGPGSSVCRHHSVDRQAYVCQRDVPQHPSWLPGGLPPSHVTSGFSPHLTAIHFRKSSLPACLPQYWLLTVAAKEKITSPVSILAQTKILINIVWLSVQVTNHILHHIMLRMESGSSCICQHACTQDSLVWLMWCSSRCAMCINHGTLGMWISKRRFLTCYWVYLTSHRQCLWTSLKSLLKNVGKKSLDQLK